MDAREIRMQKDGKAADGARKPTEPRKVGMHPWLRAFALGSALAGPAACNSGGNGDLPNVTVKACNADGCKEIKYGKGLKVKKGEKATVVMEAREDSICFTNERHDEDSRDSRLGDTGTLTCNVVEEKKKQEVLTSAGIATVVVACFLFLGTVGAGVAIGIKRDNKNRSKKGGPGEQ